MGRVAGSYGVRGWLKVAPDGGGAEGLVAVKTWWIGEEPRKVTAARVHGATVVAKLAGIESREQALVLKGSRVAVARSALPDPGEGHYYLADLIGLEVVNGKGEALGTVKRMFSSGPQDVMELQGERERLIPWVPAIVRSVDLSRRQIVVAWELDW